MWLDMNECDPPSELLVSHYESVFVSGELRPPHLGHTHAVRR
jgi:hypothetical protein